MTRVNVDGTRRVLDAAAAAGVRKIVRPSSAAVYGAWANNPVPLTEDAPLRPNPGFLPAIVDAECERLLAEWADAHGRSGGDAAAHRAGRRRRCAARCSPRPRPGTPPVRVRGTRRRRCRSCTSTTSRAALALAVEQSISTACYNVAADGWLASERRGALLPAPALPGVPDELAERVPRR